MLFPKFARRLRVPYEWDLDNMRVMLMLGVFKEDGPMIRDLHRDTVVSIRPLTDLYWSELGELRCDAITDFDDVDDDTMHDAVVLYHWTGDALDSRLIAFWRHDVCSGPLKVDWSRMKDGILTA